MYSITTDPSTMCAPSVFRKCQVVQQTGPSKVCALVTTKCGTGVHRLANIMTVQLFNWSKQSFWSTGLNISMNGLSKVCALEGNLGFFRNILHEYLCQKLIQGFQFSISDKVSKKLTAWLKFVLMNILFIFGLIGKIWGEIWKNLHKTIYLYILL